MSASAWLVAATLWTFAPPTPAAEVGPPGFDGDTRALSPDTLIPRGRKVGTPTTLFVNFDGVEIGECDPSNSKRDCHWLREGNTYPAWSGSLQTRVSILQTARSVLEEFGVRVTSRRPPDREDYTMVVYGGDADNEGVLGIAPAGDCNDALPNQIAFAFLDGRRRTWVNGGATTLIHEAGHTWGLDHINERFAVMNPFGDNTRTSVAEACTPVVGSSDLEPADARCEARAIEECGSIAVQHSGRRLRWLFGGAYVDDISPRLSLVSPFDGKYFEGPGAAFLVDVDIDDDLHEQAYAFEIEIPGLLDTPAQFETYDGDFELDGLPLGEWTIHIRAWDEAGNLGELEFGVVVGDTAIEDLPLDDGCSVSPRDDGRWTLVLTLWLPWVARRRSRRYNLAAMKRVHRPLLLGAILAPALGCPSAVEENPVVTSGGPQTDASDPRVVEVDGELYAKDAPSNPEAATEVSDVNPGAGVPDETNGVCRLYSPGHPEPECCGPETGFDASFARQLCGHDAFLGESATASCGYYFTTSKSNEPAHFRAAQVIGKDAKSAAEAEANRLGRAQPDQISKATPFPGIPGAYRVDTGYIHYAFVDGWKNVRQFAWNDDSCDESKILELVAHFRNAAEPTGDARRPLLPTARGPGGSLPEGTALSAPPTEPAQ